MSEYFRHFPTVEYNGKTLLNITKRADFKDSVFYDKYAFYPYSIVGDDRIEDVANFYYGSMKYTWVVCFSNGITDPYYDWPLTVRAFEKMFTKKYETLSGTTGQAVIDWGQNENITDNIVHYSLKANTDMLISKDTYTLDDTLQQEDWQPVRYFQLESELNDNKRFINLLDSRYLPQAEAELRALMNE